MSKRLATFRDTARSDPAELKAYAYTALALAIACLVMVPFREDLGILNVALVFLLLCLGVALTAGSGPAILAAISSFLLFDVVFIPPYHTFTIARSDHVLALFAFLAVAIITSQLAARAKERTQRAERERHRTDLLYQLNAALVGETAVNEILSTIVERVVGVYGARSSRILRPGANGRLQILATYPPGDRESPDVNRQELAMALAAMNQRRPAGLGTSRRRVLKPHGVHAPLPPPVERERDSDVLYIPIGTSERTIGVLEVRGRPGGGRFNEEDRNLLTSFANQAALALERVRLSEEAARAQVLAQSDELKSALLAAVSHNLRTPLAAIKASVTSLMDSSVAWDQEARNEFLDAINEETDRLTLMVSNLLDLSRIEGGALRPDRDWYDVKELISSVKGRLAARAALTNHQIESSIDPAVSLGFFDYVEIEQVLMNLVENALKYTPAGSMVSIAVHEDANGLEFSVRDNGPGIDPASRARLFEKFYRSEGTSRIPGAGIGLAICRGLVEAHGGRIWVESEVRRGTTFTFTIPYDRSTLAQPEAA